MLFLVLHNSFRISISFRNPIRLTASKLTTEQVEQMHRPSKKFKPNPYQYHEEITIDIENLTNEGVGLGRHNGWVVMVPLVIPGETVLVRVYKNNPNYSEADLVEVLKPSPDRVTPSCPYFTHCGGCQYQHINIQAQRKWKQKQVENLLETIGQLKNLTVNEVVGTQDLFGYRTKLTPHYDTIKDTNNVKIGFQQRGTHNIVDIEDCMIGTPKIGEKYKEFRSKFFQDLSQLAPTEHLPPNRAPKKGATLLFRECEEGVVTDPRQIVTQKVENIFFRFKAGEFFQNNAFVLPLMVRHVLGKATGDGCTNLIDTYCGSGLFALCASNQFEQVYGIEVSEMAVRAAQDTAVHNKISNAQFICGSAEAIFKKVDHLPAANTVVVIDPPRKGCDNVFLKQLAKFKPRKVVYVSCDPATQARDAQSIVAAGYVVVDTTPFDLFPQTRHIENVMTFLLPLEGGGTPGEVHVTAEALSTLSALDPGPISEEKKGDSK